MAIFRAIVLGAALTLAVTPVAAMAADTSFEHTQAELANGFAQLDLTQQQVADLQTQANLAAANERMIALLRSQAQRERQLNLVANATAMEEIAAALANSARMQGDANAVNALAIAQIKAARLITIADANMANAQAIGRFEEIVNARAQSQALRGLADFITGQMAEMNISNEKLIGQERADAIHTPALVEQKNGQAMGANALLAADTALAAGQLNATSVTLSINARGADKLAHAYASLQNAKVMAQVE
jgi:hypothetical protein